MRTAGIDGMWESRNKYKEYTGHEYNVKRMQSSVLDFKFSRREILTQRNCSMWRRIFWYQTFGETSCLNFDCLNLQYIWNNYSMLFSDIICEDKDSSNLKMETVGSSETLLLIYQSTPRHIPQDWNLNSKYLGEKICCYGSGKMVVM
jgi:hypothetical protein